MVLTNEKNIVVNMYIALSALSFFVSAESVTCLRQWWKEYKQHSLGCIVSFSVGVSSRSLHCRLVPENITWLWSCTQNISSLFQINNLVHVYPPSTCEWFLCLSCLLDQISLVLIFFFPGNQPATLWNIFFSILVCSNRKQYGKKFLEAQWYTCRFVIGSVSGVNGANQIASSQM